MLFSYGFDNQITIWNLSNKGGIVTLKNINFDIEDCLWLPPKILNNDYNLISCGENNVHIMSLDPYQGSLDIRPFNLKKIKRKFIKIFHIENTSFVLCGSLTGDLLLLDLKFEKFLVKEIHSSTDISRAKHHMTNTYPVIKDTPKVTHILYLSIDQALVNRGNPLNKRVIVIKLTHL